MNHIEFIEKNVREELIRQGFTQAVAQGGHFRPSICTSACLRQVVREAFLMMLCATPGCGLRSKPALQKSEKQRNQSVRGITRLGCSEWVKTVVRQHSQSSECEKRALSSRSEYVKYR